MSYTNEKNQSAHSPSDGSELITAEVQANIRKEATYTPLGAGYRVDEEGIVNNYAIEPEMSTAEYPSPKQQRRYIVQGAAAILFVALALWIAFRVS